jgi:hypothetical protein
MYLTRPSLSLPKLPDAVFAQRTVSVRSIALPGIETRPADEDVLTPAPCRRSSSRQRSEAPRRASRRRRGRAPGEPPRADSGSAKGEGPGSGEARSRDREEGERALEPRVDLPTSFSVTHDALHRSLRLHQWPHRSTVDTSNEGRGGHEVSIRGSRRDGGNSSVRVRGAVRRDRPRNSRPVV